MKKTAILFLVINLFFLAGCDALPDNRYDQPIPVLLAAEIRASDYRHIHLVFSEEMASAIPAGSGGFTVISGGVTNTNLVLSKTATNTYSLFVTNRLYPTNSMTISYLSAGPIISVSGGILGTFSNVQIVNNLVDLPLIWNTLGSITEVENSSIGTNLVVRTGLHYFGPGCFGNGFLTPDDATYGNGIYVPANSIPRGDLTVEFWYVRTGSFSSNVHMKLVSGQDVNPGWTQLLSLSVCPYMYKNSVNYGCVIEARMRISSSAVNEIQAHHSFGDLADLEAIFPLNTPVHVALTKRNSDGMLGVYLDGQLLSLQYLKEPAGVTNDYSFLSGKTGYFPFKLGIGNNFESTLPGEPACGIIDNIKIYSIVKTNFSDRFTEGYIY